MAEKSIDIAIKAQNLADAGLKSAEKSVEQSIRSMNKKLQQGFEAGGFVAALTVASGGLKALTAGMSGDLEKMADEAERLPLGIGQAFSIGRQLREIFTGERAELEAINANIERMNSILRTSQTLWKIQQKAVEGFADAIRDSQDRMALLGLEGVEKELKQAEQAREKSTRSIQEQADQQKAAYDKAYQEQTKSLQEELEKQQQLLEDHSTGLLTSGSGAAAAEKAIASLSAELERFQKVRDEARAKIDAGAKDAAAQAGVEFEASSADITRRDQEKQAEEQRKAAEKQADEQRKAAEKIAQEQQKEAEKAADEKLRLAREMASLESEILQKQLTAEGKTLEARMEQIRQHYAARIEAAKDAGEKEKLAQLQALDEAAAKAAADEAAARDKVKGPADQQRGVSTFALDRNFVGLAAGFGSQRDSAKETANEVKQSNRTLREQDKTLKQILREMQNGRGLGVATLNVN